jgi:hypothetical protein
MDVPSSPMAPMPEDDAETLEPDHPLGTARAQLHETYILG